jgi:hypothetical protein
VRSHPSKRWKAILSDLQEMIAGFRDASIVFPAVGAPSSDNAADHPSQPSMDASPRFDRLADLHLAGDIWA